MRAMKKLLSGRFACLGRLRVARGARTAGKFLLSFRLQRDDAVVAAKTGNTVFIVAVIITVVYHFKVAVFGMLVFCVVAFAAGLQRDLVSDGMVADSATSLGIANKSRGVLRHFIMA